MTNKQYEFLTDSSLALDNYNIAEFLNVNLKEIVINTLYYKFLKMWQYYQLSEIISTFEEEINRYISLNLHNEETTFKQLIENAIALYIEEMSDENIVKKYAESEIIPLIVDYMNDKFEDTNREYAIYIRDIYSDLYELNFTPQDIINKVILQIKEQYEKSIQNLFLKR